MGHGLAGFVDERVVGNRAPVLLFLAGRDRIIDNAGVIEVLEQGSESSLQIIEYPDQTHSIQFDAPARMVDDIVRWLDRRILSVNDR